MPSYTPYTDSSSSSESETYDSSEHFDSSDSEHESPTEGWKSVTSRRSRRNSKSTSPSPQPEEKKLETQLSFDFAITPGSCEDKYLRLLAEVSCRRFSSVYRMDVLSFRFWRDAHALTKSVGKFWHSESFELKHWKWDFLHYTAHIAFMGRHGTRAASAHIYVHPKTGKLVYITIHGNFKEEMAVEREYRRLGIYRENTMKRSKTISDLHMNRRKLGKLAP